MSLLSVILQIALLAAVAGFWPSLFLILALWEQRDQEHLGKNTARFFPAVVFPWIFSVGITFAFLLYIIVTSVQRR